MTWTRRSLLTPAAMTAVALTMLSLNQVFVRQRWLAPSLVAVCLAFGAGWVGRRLDVPGILAPALSVLALVTWLGIAFHGDTTLYGIPTGRTMQAIGESLRQSGRDITELAAPAEATNALTLLSVTGVFLVSVLVDIMVFRLRRPVAAGIPLLALFLVPTSLAPKGNAFAFALAAFGYLALLVAEGRDRARAWGRRLSGIDRLDEVNDVSHVARVGRRIGTAAVGLALVVPVALPSVGQGMFSGAGGGPFGRGKGGSQTVVVISPIVEIRRQLQSSTVQNLFTVRTDSGNDYLRLTSLDEFNGAEWKLVTQRASDDNKLGKDNPIPTPREHDGIATVEKRLEVSVGPLAVQWLPVPYAPRVVDVKGNWKYDSPTLAVFSPKDGKTSKDVSYTVTSRIPRPTAEQLRAGGSVPDAILTRYLPLPDTPMPPIVQRAYEDAVDGKSNPYDVAVSMQEYFQKRGRFTYSLNAAQGSGSDALVSFLTDRVGYCEQFAATMAYFARVAGIPARVAVGFTRGIQVDNGVWQVTNKDAHAWPELYFPSAGWVRFEPTPQGEGRVERPEWAPAPVDSPIGGDPTVDPSSEPSAEPTASESGLPRQRDTADDTAAEDGQNGGGVRGVARRMGALPLVLLVLALAAATPSLVGYFARRRRRRRAVDATGRTHAAWESLADAAEDAGYPLRPSDSPRASARRLVTAAGLAGAPADEVARLATAEERARYARSATPVDGLEASAREVRKALLASLPRWSRVRATVFPASGLRRIVAAFGAVNAWNERSRDAVRARLAALLRRRPARA